MIYIIILLDNSLDQKKLSEYNVSNILEKPQTSSTKANSRLLSEVGITIGKENKLELDEDKLKNANISTLKTLFTGTNSFADRIAQKADAISKAISNSAKSYTSSGSVLPSSFSKMFETEI